MHSKHHQINVRCFDEKPQDFILSDMKGSNIESCHKCTQELLHAMFHQFKSQTTQLSSHHVTQMFFALFDNKANKWQNNDAAINLMLGISIQVESVQFGVHEVNEGVNVIDLFSQYILMEQQEADMNVRPMVMATSIKFVSIFRYQFSKEHLKALMSLLIAHLGLSHIVVNTYSAVSMEKILTT